MADPMSVALVYEYLMRLNFFLICSGGIKHCNRASGVYLMMSDYCPFGNNLPELLL